MASAKPSRSSIANVIAALREAGQEPGEIDVRADGSFTVRATPKPVDPPKASGKMPRRFGQAAG